MIDFRQLDVHYNKANTIYLNSSVFPIAVVTNCPKQHTFSCLTVLEIDHWGGSLEGVTSGSVAHQLVLPWASDVVSMDLCFLICKMGLITPPSQVCVKIMNVRPLAWFLVHSKGLINVRLCYFFRYLTHIECLKIFLIIE